MINRCHRPSFRGFKDYGGRGISVCDRWLGPDGHTNFLKDMGPKPSRHHTLDRINVDGNYEPGNCRWATFAEQARNRRNTHRITHEGVTLCITDWAKRVGVCATVINQRLRAGWSVAAALTKLRRNR